MRGQGMANRCGPIILRWVDEDNSNPALNSQSRCSSVVTVPLWDLQMWAMGLVTRDEITKHLFVLSLKGDSGTVVWCFLHLENKIFLQISPQFRKGKEWNVKSFGVHLSKNPTELIQLVCLGHCCHVQSFPYGSCYCCSFPISLTQIKPTENSKCIYTRPEIRGLPSVTHMFSTFSQWQEINYTQPDTDAEIMPDTRDFLLNRKKIFADRDAQTVTEIKVWFDPVIGYYSRSQVGLFSPADSRDHTRIKWLSLSPDN